MAGFTGEVFIENLAFELGLKDKQDLYIENRKISVNKVAKRR